MGLLHIYKKENNLRAHNAEGKVHYHGGVFNGGGIGRELQMERVHQSFWTDESAHSIDSKTKKLQAKNQRVFENWDSGRNF